jgi:hypothetical protein
MRVGHYNPTDHSFHPKSEQSITPEGSYAPEKKQLVPNGAA